MALEWIDEHDYDATDEAVARAASVVPPAFLRLLYVACEVDGYVRNGLAVPGDVAASLTTAVTDAWRVKR